MNMEYFLNVIIYLKKENRIIGQKLKHLSNLKESFKNKQVKQNVLADWVYTQPNSEELKKITQDMLAANQKVLDYKQRISYSEVKAKQKENGKTIMKLREALKNVHSISS